MEIHTPDWVKHAVFYQIFPDRFARSHRVAHQKRLPLKPWGTDPAEQGFQGGDLYGIVDHLDALADLGVTALYLNPIFASASNHRYHTYDYYAVDPILGGNRALRALLDAAHDRDMRVVLDGVFNHASRGFWAFHHILETGGDSPYIDWFDIDDWPLRPYAPGDTPHNYGAWMDIPALPEFNTDHPPVREYLFDVARHWVEFGIDGWRLDVPTEIDDDRFWRQFRDEVRAVNPDAYLVGEIWTEAQRWLQGDQFDAVMNYPRTSAVISFFGGASLRDWSHPLLSFEALKAPAFADEVERLLDLYDWEVTCAQLNLLSSHDMPRARWIMGGDADALTLAMLFQMTMPGAPCIYYGDEVGMQSAGDPHCREAFPWDAEDWNEAVRRSVQRAAQLRNRYEVLRTGDYETLFAEGAVMAFRRSTASAEAVAVFNAGTAEGKIPDVVRHAADGMKRVWPDVSSREDARLEAQHAAVWISEA